MSSNPFDTISQSLSGFFQAKGLQNLENPVTQLIKQSLQDMEFVSLEEFETQRQVLERLRSRVKLLEERIEVLEKRNHSN
ncbi:MAG: accessory factor UbiK family protein [Limnobacter sp.]|nr:accessory factor UbiK family protein [Limnobacter sp.]